MSRENVEAVRRIHAEWAKGNMWADKERYADDVVFTSDWSDSERTQGVAELSRYMLEFLRQWGRWRVEAQKFTALSDSVILVEGRSIAIGAGSGITAESPWFGVWVLERGKVAQLHVHHDLAAVLKAAGLAE